MDEHYDVDSDGYVEPESYLEPDDDRTPSSEDLEPDGTTSEYYDGGEDAGVTAAEPDIAQLPSELRFGALIGPYGETEDSYAEKINYSTTTDSYIGAQSGRQIDPWTDTEKT